MCFSAEVSLAASGALAFVSVNTIMRVSDKRDIFIAFIPLIFAFQQLTEGLLWIALEVGEMPQTQFWLSNLYGIFIGVIWPLYAPFAISWGERENRSQKVMTSMLLVGLGLAVYTIIGLIDEPVHAFIINDSIRYVHDVAGQQFVMVMYLFATCVPFILSSDRLLNITGAVIILGFFVAFYAYRETFASVWCFFAALASALIYLYIISQRKKLERSTVIEN